MYVNDCVGNYNDDGRTAPKACCDCCLITFIEKVYLLCYEAGSPQYLLETVSKPCKY